jgi:hypothetical protein
MGKWHGLPVLTSCAVLCYAGQALAEDEEVAHLEAQLKGYDDLQSLKAPQGPKLVATARVRTDILYIHIHIHIIILKNIPEICGICLKSRDHAAQKFRLQSEGKPDSLVLCAMWLCVAGGAEEHGRGAGRVHVRHTITSASHLYSYI